MPDRSLDQLDQLALRELSQWQPHTDRKIPEEAARRLVGAKLNKVDVATDRDEGRGWLNLKVSIPFSL